VPIAGDWNGSGVTQIGVYRPSAHTFYLREVAPAPAPPAPVVTTPVATPLPVPGRGTKAHPRVRTKVVIRWTWNGARTRLRTLTMTRLPRGAKITVRCVGPGCRHRARVATARGVRRLVRSLEHTVYRAGDRLVITISAPGRVAERAEVRIRNGRVPRVREL
jgi:hypothetical protein